MSDEDYSNIYDTVQKGVIYEVPEDSDADQEDVRPENTLYATGLQNHEYDSVSVYAVRDEENSLASSQAEAEGYLLPDEECPEVQDPQPADSQEDRDISGEEFHLPLQDQEPCPEEPQENGRVIKEDLPSPASFTVQRCQAFFTSKDSPTSYSETDDLKEIQTDSSNPEISLFVKVRAASGRHLHT
ncbi:Chloride intracellular channel protein 5 [Sciurus carolinensis]|uniref:Chloride intracellular channel protein 5 n=1 Tax=Sciurus carolinensis TaxID=30640 RepID=A0AA41MKE8_SCICA|nr:Chloride intracellular channel protein 5 [Sciurus carolinensis]